MPPAGFSLPSQLQFLHDASENFPKVPCSGFRNRGVMYPHYPTHFEKTMLARDIVDKIPEHC